MTMWLMVAAVLGSEELPGYATCSAERWDVATALEGKSTDSDDSSFKCQMGCYCDLETMELFSEFCTEEGELSTGETVPFLKGGVVVGSAPTDTTEYGSCLDDWKETTYVRATLTMEIAEVGEGAPCAAYLTGGTCSSVSATGDTCTTMVGNALEAAMCASSSSERRRQACAAGDICEPECWHSEENGLCKWLNPPEDDEECCDPDVEGESEEDGCYCTAWDRRRMEMARRRGERDTEICICVDPSPGNPDAECAILGEEGCEDGSEGCLCYELCTEPGGCDRRREDRLDCRCTDPHMNGMEAPPVCTVGEPYSEPGDGIECHPADCEDCWDRRRKVWGAQRRRRFELAMTGGSDKRRREDDRPSANGEEDNCYVEAEDAECICIDDTNTLCENTKCCHGTDAWDTAMCVCTEECRRRAPRFRRRNHRATHTTVSQAFFLIHAATVTAAQPSLFGAGRRREESDEESSMAYTIEMELETTYAELEEIVETIADNGMNFRMAFAEELEWQLTGDDTADDGIPSSVLQVEAETLYLQTGEENSMSMEMSEPAAAANLEEEEDAFFGNHPLVICIMLFLLLIGVAIGYGVAKCVSKNDAHRDEKMATEIVRKLSTENHGETQATRGGPSV